MAGLKQRISRLADRARAESLEHEQLRQREAAAFDKLLAENRAKYPQSAIDALIQQNDAAALRDYHRKLTDGVIPLDTPPRFLGHSLESFPMGHTDEIAIALKSLNEGRGIYLWGPVGSGKTGLAIALRNSFLCSHTQISLAWDPERMANCGPNYQYLCSTASKFIRCPHILNSSSLDQLQTDIWTITCDGDGIIILDDLGAGDLAEWKSPRLTEFVNYLYEQCVTVIVTSNFSLKEIGENIDDRLASRLCSMCYPVLLNQADLRLQQTQNDRLIHRRLLQTQRQHGHIDNNRNQKQEH